MKKKTKYRHPRSRAVESLIHFGEFLLATVILLIICGVLIMRTVAAGPSDSAKRDAVRALTARPATSFLAEMFYSEEEIQKYTANTVQQTQP